MSPRAETFWKIWGTPLAVLVGFAGLGWSITTTVGGVVMGEVKELHSTTAMAKQTRGELAAHLADAQVKKDKRDDWAKDIESDISDLKVDMARVMTKDHLVNR